jgi:hypothetical protein
LLTAVLVDDLQSQDEAMAALAKVLRAFADEPTGVRADVRSAAACTLQALLQHKDVRARLDSSHVLHRAADRSKHAQQVATGTPVVPPRLWLPVTIVARLLSNEAPFAYAGDLSDSATAALQNLQTDLEAVLPALDVELFFADAREAAIGAACAEAREEASAEFRRGGRVRTSTRCRASASCSRATATPGSGTGLPRAARHHRPARRRQPAAPAGPDGVQQPRGDRSRRRRLRRVRPQQHERHRGRRHPFLPVDVPQPLADGSVVRIRPFRLTFHLLTPGSDPTLGSAPLDAEALHDRLLAAHARAHGQPAAAVHEALRDLLRQAARLVVGGKLLLAVLQDARFGSVGAVDGTRSTVGAELLAAAQARALQQVARSLVPGGEPTTPELVQQFASRLAKFVEATSQWIERTLELKKVLRGKHLESSGCSRPWPDASPVRTAAEVRAANRWALAPDADPANVARFLDGMRRRAGRAVARQPSAAAPRCANGSNRRGWCRPPAAVRRRHVHRRCGKAYERAFRGSPATGVGRRRTRRAAGAGAAREVIPRWHGRRGQAIFAAERKPRDEVGFRVPGMAHEAARPDPGPAPAGPVVGRRHGVPPVREVQEKEGRRRRGRCRPRRSSTDLRHALRPRVVPARRRVRRLRQRRDDQDPDLDPLVRGPGRGLVLEVGADARRQPLARLLAQARTRPPARTVSARRTRDAGETDSRPISLTEGAKAPGETPTQIARRFRELERAERDCVAKLPKLMHDVDARAAAAEYLSFAEISAQQGGVRTQGDTAQPLHAGTRDHASALGTKLDELGTKIQGWSGRGGVADR